MTLATVTALVFLALAIRWAKFTYIASEPALLAYAQELEAAEQATSSPAGEDAATVLKRELVRQHAAATRDNRAINQRRVRHRTSAGMATLVSVLATILLLRLASGVPILGLSNPVPETPLMTSPPVPKPEVPEPQQPKPGPARVTPPPMRVVEKGWFTLRETTVPVEEVERWNDERRRQGRQ